MTWTFTRLDKFLNIGTGSFKAASKETKRFKLSPKTLSNRSCNVKVSLEYSFPNKSTTDNTITCLIQTHFFKYSFIYLKTISRHIFSRCYSYFCSNLTQTYKNIIRFGTCLSMNSVNDKIIYFILNSFAYFCHYNYEISVSSICPKDRKVKTFWIHFSCHHQKLTI